jgi:hypothetical protein
MKKHEGLSRENMIDFIHEYWDAFNKYAQNPDTVLKMKDFFTDDSVVTIYIAKKKIVNVGEFLMFESSHPHIEETLIPEEYYVDDEKQVVSVRLKTILKKTTTGEERAPICSVHYHLNLDNDGYIRIKQLHIFMEGFNPDMETIPQYFEMEELFYKEFEF